MPQFFLYMLHAMYMLCSDFSIKSGQLKNQNEVETKYQAEAQS